MYEPGWGSQKAQDWEGRGTNAHFSFPLPRCPGAGRCPVSCLEEVSLLWWEGPSWMGEPWAVAQHRWRRMTV